MKKTFLFVISALLLAACEKQASVEPGTDFIKFNAGLVSVKGNVVELESLDSFKVSASAQNLTYFKDMTARSSDKGRTWTSDAQYKWPQYDLTFRAVSRANGTEVFEEGKCRIDCFYVPEKVEDQQDFVVASAFSKAEGRENSATVDLVFHHATAGISVKAANDNTSAYVIKVYGVKYGNLRASDTIVLPSDGASVRGSDWASWDDKTYSESTSTDYKVVWSEPVVLTSEAASVSGGKNLFLIPQCRDKWKAVNHATCTPQNRGSYLSLLVNITTVDGCPVYPTSTTYIKEGVNAAWDAVGVDLELLPGYTNSFTLNFFKDGGAGQEDPEDPEDDDHSGDPILNGPIKVNVSVDAWTEGYGKVIDMK